MPYDEAQWKRESLAHYLSIAAIKVPRAIEEALMLAGAAEAQSCGGLTGLVAKLREELEKRYPGRVPKERANDLRTPGGHEDRSPARRDARRRG